MEIERLQVVLELESANFNSQVTAFQNKIAGVGTVAGTAAKAMSSSLTGIMGVIANMGIGSAMVKNLNPASKAVKAEMASMAKAMSSSMAEASQRSEASMKGMASGMSSATSQMSASMEQAASGMTSGMDKAMTGMDKVASSAMNDIKSSMTDMAKTLENIEINININIEPAMEDLDDIRKKMEELKNTPIIQTFKNADGSEGEFNESYDSAENPGGPAKEYESARHDNAGKAEAQGVTNNLKKNMGTIIPAMDEFKAKLDAKAKEIAGYQSILDAGPKKASFRVGGVSGGGPGSGDPDLPSGPSSSHKGKVDTDDDVPMLTQIRGVMDTVRDNLTQLVSQNRAEANDDSDSAFVTMNSELRQIHEDTSAIRVRMATGIANSVPGGIGATGKTVMAGAAGGAAGGSIFGSIPAMLIAAVAASAYIIKDSIGSAMDAVESDSMFSTVFAGAAPEMKQWSEGAGTGQTQMYNSGSQAGQMAPQDLGLDSVQMRENSAIIYAMTSAMGAASEPARQMSQDVAMLSNDMASFYNMSSDEAFNKIRAGIAGETEGLKALGIIVDEATVKEYAYSSGMARRGTELSAGQKALARYNVIMNSTTLAQGDLARTINSPANQLRVLRTNLEMVRRSLGQAFLPIISVILPILNSFMRGLNTVLLYVGAFMRILFGKPATGDSSGGTAALTAGYNAAGDAAEGAAAKAAKAKGSMMGFDEINTLSMSEPAGGGGAGGGGGVSIPDISGDGIFEQVEEQMDAYEAKVQAFLDKAKGWLPAIAAIAAGFALLWTASHWGKIIGALGTLSTKFGFLSPILGPVVTAMKAVGIAISGLGAGPIALIIIIIAGLIAIIVDLWQNSETFRNNMIIAWNAVKDAFVTAGALIWEKGIKPLIESLKNLWTQFHGLYIKIRPVLEFIITMVVAIVAGVVVAAVTIIGVIATVLLKVIAFAVNVIAAILGAITWVIENWSAMWKKVGKLASDAWTGIKNVFSGIGTWFGARFSEAWTAIKGAFSNVGTFFGGMWDTIKSKFTNVGTSIGAAVGGAFKTVMNNIFKTIENSINFFIRAINGAIKLINKIPGVNIGNVKELSIPRLARGGIVDQPMLAEIGENGREAVIPLENNLGWISELASKINGQGGGGGDRPVEVILQIGSTQLGRVVIDSLNKLSRQEGKLALNI